MTQDDIAEVIVQHFPPDLWGSAWMIGRNFDPSRHPHDDPREVLRGYIAKFLHRRELREVVQPGAFFTKGGKPHYVSPGLFGPFGERLPDKEAPEPPKLPHRDLTPLETDILRSLTLGVASSPRKATRLMGMPGGTASSRFYAIRNAHP